VDRLDFSAIGDGLWAGRMPYSAADAETLATVGVEVVINVCEDHEYWDGERDAVEPAFRSLGIAEVRLPVPDGATVPADVLDAALAAADGRAAYVHCRGGRERSAAVAIAILATRDGLRLDEAVAVARAARPTFRPLPWQVEGVRTWLQAAGAGRMLDT
jgi:atypical dual specificity phosphatase